MINISTELLRALVAVADLRSFTKAAQALGVTQPAVSAQIKRLQALLDCELFDKSAPGVLLTAVGEAVLSHARRILTINDQILDLTGPRVVGPVFRVGMAGDFAGIAVSGACAEMVKTKPEYRFVYRIHPLDELQHDLREGNLDLFLAVPPKDAIPDACENWNEELAWAARRDAADALPASPVRLVSYGGECPFQHAAIGALNGVGLHNEIIVIGSHIACLATAVIAGLGVMVLPKSCIADIPETRCCGSGWPRLPHVTFSVCIREGAGRDRRQEIAQTIASHWKKRISEQNAASAS